jgi:hypothetical protein
MCQVRRNVVFVKFGTCFLERDLTLAPLGEEWHVHGGYGVSLMATRASYVCVLWWSDLTTYACDVWFAVHDGY